MSWRPDDWEEIRGDAIGHAPTESTLAFEAGADAMLEALKKRGCLMTPEQMRVLAPDRKYPYGWLVFIEEEE